MRRKGQEPLRSLNGGYREIRVGVLRQGGREINRE
jgi:hypothetical protein